MTRVLTYFFQYKMYFFIDYNKPEFVRCCGPKFLRIRAKDFLCRFVLEIHFRGYCEGSTAEIFFHIWILYRTPQTLELILERIGPTIFLFVLELI